MIETKQNNKILDKIHLVLALFILLWLNVGTYTYISDYIAGYIKIAAYALWIFLAIAAKKEYLKDLVRITLPLLLFMIIIKISSKFANSMKLNMYLTNFVYIWIIASMAIYYMKDKVTNRKTILIILAIDCIYVGINTFIKLMSNPLISRFLSASKEVQIALLGNTKEFNAIGSYTYFYSLVMIILVGVNFFINSKNNKVIYMSLVVLLSILMIKAQFTTAILLTVVFSIKIIIENKLKNRKGWLLVFLIMIILTVLLLPKILTNITQKTNIPSEVKVRLIEINEVLQGKKSENGDLSTRMDLYSKSLNSFLSNIFIGSWGENTIRWSLYFLRFFWIIRYVCNMFIIILY